MKPETNEVLHRYYMEIAFLATPIMIMFENFLSVGI